MVPINTTCLDLGTCVQVKIVTLDKEILFRILFAVVIMELLIYKLFKQIHDLNFNH